MRTVASEISSLLEAIENCKTSGNGEWQERHRIRLVELVDRYLPSGSGIDSGTKLDRDKTTAQKLVFAMNFHHMNDGGYYDGWTEHELTVIPTFCGIEVSRVTGSNRNEIKNYLADVLRDSLNQEYDLS